jgi:CelD/BcsL family acetyltransferase involved in cellulose biosynthesis
MDWDRLELLDLPADTPMIQGTGALPGVRQFTRGVCPIADLAQGFEAYLGCLSSNRRQQARRLIREASRVEAKFELVGSSEADQAFDQLVQLHQIRWNVDGRPGVFAAPRFARFHRDLVRAWLPMERAVLARLSIGSIPAAVLYGFRTGNRFDFYQSGVSRDASTPLRSPGSLAHLLLMRELAGRGVVTYDFLRGASAHKEALSTGAVHLIGFEMWRPTLRAAAYRSAQLSERVVRRASRSLYSLSS